MASRSVIVSDSVEGGLSAAWKVVLYAVATVSETDRNVGPDLPQPRDAAGPELAVNGHETATRIRRKAPLPAHRSSTTSVFLTSHSRLTRLRVQRLFK